MAIITIDPRQISAPDLAPAAAALRAGELVAFPTETVYGLGACALSPDAVRSIFAAKGRPSNNPLIVHVASLEQARSLSSHWPEIADTLARHFWPGPITFVVPRASTIPDEVTAGLDSVGLRFPAHPIAQALIRAANVPICAPSANRYTHVSPTRAEHVIASLGDRVPWVIDGGPTRVGIESTVLSLLEERPKILRHGMISHEQLEEVLGAGSVDQLRPDAIIEDRAAPSPGLARKHYSPTCPVFLVEQIPWGELTAQDGVLLCGDASREDSDAAIVSLPASPQAYANGIYGVLHRFEREARARIFILMPPTTSEWRAILDRLSRAATS
jgi:L-threonylcarbamoyladenylate synthase